MIVYFDDIILAFFFLINSKISWDNLHFLCMPIWIMWLSACNFFGIYVFCIYMACKLLLPSLIAWSATSSSFSKFMYLVPLLDSFLLVFFRIELSILLHIFFYFVWQILIKVMLSQISSQRLLEEGDAWFSTMQYVILPKPCFMSIKDSFIDGKALLCFNISII